MLGKLRAISSRAFSINVTFTQHTNLTIQRTTIPKPKPALDETLKFGTVTTDHMLEIDWNAREGWKQPQILPFRNFSISPCASVFHYANACFEGLKAYKSAQGDILMYRPMKNMERLHNSMVSLALPEFDKEEFLKCIEQLLIVDQEWIPDKRGFSVYVRPTGIGTHPNLGVTRPQAAKLFVILTTVGPYYPTGFKPVKLYCDDKVVRAWPGGSGDKKLAANYGPTIEPTEKVISKGYQQILWLTQNYVTEVGTMNFFVFWNNEDGEKELITSPLEGTILPGVTRDSILQITKQWGEFKVSEKRFTIDQLTQALQENRVIEAFGAGTAAIVCPVEQIYYKGTDYQVPLELGNAGKLTQRLLETIQDIQYGVVPHEFCHRVNQQIS